MLALITGASSGLGADMARILSEKGIDLILVARNKKKMEQLAKELKTNVEIIPLDLSATYNCTELYNMVKKKNIDILINNAGFGLFGEFNSIKLDKELDMIDLNIKTVHTLTKLFLKDFIKKDKGYILNVASSAAFMPGPLMSTYYATKAYVLRLTEAIHEELRHNKSNVYIGALCPGPVSTNFNKVAGVKCPNNHRWPTRKFNLKSLESYDVSKYAINKMFKKKMIIIPGLSIKLGTFMTRFLSHKMQLKVAYKIQKQKEN